MILVKDSAIDNIAQILFVALCEEQHSLGVTLGCIQQALAVRVLAEAFQHGPHGARELLQILCLFFFGRLLPAPCALAGPTKPIEVDCGVLCVGAVGAASSQRCVRLIVVFYVCLTILDAVSVMHGAAV